MKRHHAPQFELPGAETVFNLAGETQVTPPPVKTSPAQPQEQPALFPQVAGCGKPTHVSGTNGGLMPCGATLTQLDGTSAPYLCAKCDPPKQSNGKTIGGFIYDNATEGRQ